MTKYPSPSLPGRTVTPAVWTVQCLAWKWALTASYWPRGPRGQEQGPGKAVSCFQLLAGWDRRAILDEMQMSLLSHGHFWPLCKFPGQRCPETPSSELPIPKLKLKCAAWQQGAYLPNTCEALTPRAGWNKGTALPRDRVSIGANSAGWGSPGALDTWQLKQDPSVLGSPAAFSSYEIQNEALFSYKSPSQSSSASAQQQRTRRTVHEPFLHLRLHR